VLYGELPVGFWEFVVVGVRKVGWRESYLERFSALRPLGVAPVVNLVE